MELLDERIGALQAEFAAGQLGAQTPFFGSSRPMEFRSSFLGAKDPIASCLWIAAMKNARQTSFCPEAANMGFASHLMKDRARGWWEEADHALGSVGVVAMSWEEFVMRFQEEFSLAIEVQPLARDFRTFARPWRLWWRSSLISKRALLAPQYAADKVMKVRYHDMLRDDIH